MDNATLCKIPKNRSFIRKMDSSIILAFLKWFLVSYPSSESPAGGRDRKTGVCVHRPIRLLSDSAGQGWRGGARPSGHLPADLSLPRVPQGVSPKLPKVYGTSSAALYSSYCHRNLAFPTHIAICDEGCARPQMKANTTDTLSG